MWAGFAAYLEDGRQVVQDGPEGVRLTVQPLRKIGPSFERQWPWRALALGGMWMLHDAGRYRMIRAHLFATAL